MPIKIPDSLPARETLLREAVDVIDSSSAHKQDIRPLNIFQNISKNTNGKKYNSGMQSIFNMLKSINKIKKSIFTKPF